MDWRRYRRLVMSVFGIIIFSFSAPGFGQEKEKISTKDIQEMVDLLETPQKREAFVKDLKNLTFLSHGPFTISPFLHDPAFLSSGSRSLSCPALS